MKKTLYKLLAAALTAAILLSMAACGGAPEGNAAGTASKNAAGRAAETMPDCAGYYVLSKIEDGEDVYEGDSLAEYCGEGWEDYIILHESGAGVYESVFRDEDGTVQTFSELGTWTDAGFTTEEWVDDWGSPNVEKRTTTYTREGNTLVNVNEAARQRGMHYKQYYTLSKNDPPMPEKYETLANYTQHSETLNEILCADDRMKVTLLDYSFDGLSSLSIHIELEPRDTYSASFYLVLNNHHLKADTINAYVLGADGEKLNSSNSSLFIGNLVPGEAKTYELLYILDDYERERLCSPLTSFHLVGLSGVDVVFDKQVEFEADAPLSSQPLYEDERISVHFEYFDEEKGQLYLGFDSKVHDPFLTRVELKPDIPNYSVALMIDGYILDGSGSNFDSMITSFNGSPLEKYRQVVSLWIAEALPAMAPTSASSFQLRLSCLADDTVSIIDLPVTFENNGDGGQKALEDYPIIGETDSCVIRYAGYRDNFRIWILAENKTDADTNLFSEPFKEKLTIGGRECAASLNLRLIEGCPVLDAVYLSKVTPEGDGSSYSLTSFNYDEDAFSGVDKLAFNVYVGDTMVSDGLAPEELVLDLTKVVN